MAYLKVVVFAKKVVSGPSTWMSQQRCRATNIGFVICFGIVEVILPPGFHELNSHDGSSLANVEPDLEPQLSSRVRYYFACGFSSR